MEVLEQSSSNNVSKTVQANWLFARLPPWIVDTLSLEQQEAIHNALDDNSSMRPPVNIRFSIPVFARVYYITIVAGEEARSEERRKHERHKYPLRTFANIFFFIGIATLFFMITLVAIAVNSTIIEF